ncbi:ROS1 kinase, partial [Amia calva]|nr:ROS1 kinase [Amia calva]
MFSFFLPAVSDEQWLFLSRMASLRRKKVADLFTEADCLPPGQLHHNIRIAIHYISKQIYFCEGNHIWMKGALNLSDISDLKNVYAGPEEIKSVSVDWLYKKIYFVMGGKVWYCKLDNCNNTVDFSLTYHGSVTRIVADPYNGYIFLLMDDGIYRVNLPEFPGQNNDTHQAVRSNAVRDFVVNYQSKRLLYFNETDKSISSVFLDGSLFHSMRPPLKAIQTLVSVTYEHNLFMLSDGKSVYQETNSGDTFFYNEYMVDCDLDSIDLFGFDNLHFFSESSQPYPLPKKPNHLKVLFGSDMALLKWETPLAMIGAMKVLCPVGPAAWQNWTYSVRISALNLSVVQEYRDIVDTQIAVQGLESSSSYSMAVWAESPAGRSHSPSVFEGTTLKKVDNDPYIIAAGEKGLWKQKLESFDSQCLVFADLKEVQDIDWYNSTIFWSNTSGYIHGMMMNQNNRSCVLSAVHKAGALAYDWLGQHLYWADLTSSMIYRKSMISGVRQVVTQGQYLVRDLAIDSVNGFIYWTTAYTVEGSRLDGKDHLTFQQLPSSGKQATGFTIDITEGHCYWLVQDDSVLHLYRASLLNDGFMDIDIMEYASWSSSWISYHSLAYYSGRMFWLDRDGMLTVQELNSSRSVAYSADTQMTAFVLFQKTLKPLPDGFVSPPVVIPQPVPKTSIQITGNHSIFRVFWEPSSNVEYGTVFYCVESGTLPNWQGHLGLKSGFASFCLAWNVLSMPVFEVRGLRPYSRFDISITPYTYWGRANTTTAILRAPEGAPSAPLRPRIFVLSAGSLRDLEMVQVEFRWDTPEKSNGVIVKYLMYYSVLNITHISSSSIIWEKKNISASETFYKLSDVQRGSVVQFQVQAFTSLGPGKMSNISLTNTSSKFLTPVPRILISADRNISLLDLDTRQAVQLVTLGGNAALISSGVDGFLYDIHDNMLFKTNILTDDRLIKAVDLTIDWIGRRLFIAPDITLNYTQLFVIDLELKNTTLEVINIQQNHTRSAPYALAMYPLLSRVYWVESSAVENRIAYFSLNSQSVHYVFRNPNETKDLSFNRQSCNCTAAQFKLGLAMALDTSHPENGNIYFSTQMGEIWVSDLEGCWCKHVTRVPLQPGGIIRRLAVDTKFVYWTAMSGNNETVFHMEKSGDQQGAVFTAKQPVHLAVYNSQLQHYPDKNCLIPAPSKDKPRIINASNSSFLLDLPLSRPLLQCNGITLPTPTYLLHYGIVLDNSRENCTHGLQCSVVEAQENIFHLQGLQPFTSYVIQTAVKNLYGGFEDQLGEAVIGLTLCGTPVAVTDVSPSVVSDTAVNITWTESPKPNCASDKVRYQALINMLDFYPPTPLTKEDFPGHSLTLTINSFREGSSNSIVVLAFHPTENWSSASTPLRVITFQAPLAPKLLSAGNTSVELQWRAPSDNSTRAFWVELREHVKNSNWFQPQTDCKNGPVTICKLFGILPNRQYFAHIKVLYRTEAEGVSPSLPFRTTAGVPGKPGVPQVWHNGKKIVWQQAEDNGGNITFYILESRQVRMKRVLENETGAGPWGLVHNDSCSSSVCTWEVENHMGTFQFRAAAANLLGLGEYSDASEAIEMHGNSSALETINVAVITAIVTVTLLIPTVVFGLVYIRRRKRKESGANNICIDLKPDAELDQIRGLVGLVDNCYAVSPLPDQYENSTLPVFPRERLRLQRFLGSGAFGEVYEGLAVNILGEGGGETKVAVKTLKKGATDHEKAEFLKEAHLMSQFDHPNILKLLGVCLLNEPQYIILELMRGGDLSSYLRGARETTGHHPLLNSSDLLDICVDVSKGCSYLEKRHFVHRDLAARNCLVSVKEYDDPGRAVKIGDFGLARDIYRSDYYRKRGEALLPVRWMSPESLIDGIFTKYSDVW